MSLIVNLDEFSELCGVTAETMRGYVRAVEGSPAWLIERGSKGKDYKIEAEGGIAWWKRLREEEETSSAERQAALAQLRLDLLGDQVESAEALALSGKQRREEMAAALERIKLRRIMGELVERAAIEEQLSSAAVEARRRLQLVSMEYAAIAGLAPENVRSLADLIEAAVNEFVSAIALPAAGGGSGA